MRTAASIFSWLGGIINAIILITAGARGAEVPHYVYRGNSYYTEIQHVATPGWLWAIFVIIIIADLGILIWREISVSDGEKTASGIVTLIFVSLVGGILTLCLPPEQCGSRAYRAAVSDRNNRTNGVSNASHGPSEPSDASYNPFYSKYHENPSKAVDMPEPVLGLKEGEKVRLKKDIKTMDGNWINLGTIGVVTTPNGRGEPVITFEGDKRIRVIEKYLERVEEETKPE